MWELSAQRYAFTIANSMSSHYCSILLLSLHCLGTKGKVSALKLCPHPGIGFDKFFGILLSMFCFLKIYHYLFRNAYNIL